MVLLSIDPALATFCCVTLDEDTLEELDCEVVSLGRMSETTDVTFSQAVHNHLRTRWQPEITPSVIIIESQQLSRLMISIESITVMACVALWPNAKIVLMHAGTVKAHFKELGRKGYRQNKQRAVSLAKKLNYDVDSSHEADAILQALTWYDQNHERCKNSRR